MVYEWVISHEDTETQNVCCIFFSFFSNFSQKNSIVDRFIWTFWISYWLHTFLKCFPVTFKILSVIQRRGLFSVREFTVKYRPISSTAFVRCKLFKYFTASWMKIASSILRSANIYTRIIYATEIFHLVRQRFNRFNL